MLIFIKSKDDPKKIPPRLQLNPEWRIPRDPSTGALLPEGRLWAFTDKIAASRREGKNRRDGATVSTRVLALADRIGTQLFDEAIKAAGVKGGAPVTLTPEEAAAGKTGSTTERQRRRTFDPDSPPSARL